MMSPRVRLSGRVRRLVASARLPVAASGARTTKLNPRFVSVTGFGCGSGAHRSRGAVSVIVPVRNRGCTADGARNGAPSRHVSLPVRAGAMTGAKHMLRTSLLAAGALVLSACGQQATTKTDTAQAPPAETQAPAVPAPAQAAMTDAEFVQAVANAGAFEIQTSQLAATHAARQPVKELASMMVRDHTRLASELTALAPRINVPAPTAQLDGGQTATLASLRGKTGEAFDDAYLDAQVEAHQNAVSAFEGFVASAQPGPLRDWANATLPKLRTHLSSAQALENAT